jgi:CspA family cold shock protein
MNGTVKRLVKDKGFGFIGADRGVECFFHRSACTGTSFEQLREGQSVSFDIGEGRKDRALRTSEARADVEWEIFPGGGREFHTTPTERLDLSHCGSSQNR